MKAKNISFPLIVIVIIAFLIFLSTTGKKPPPIPSDAAHMSITDQRGCLDCHGPDKKNALKKEHPPKEMCFECHKIKK